jgi:tetratricopeptide (TPR) repeat protein
MQPDLQRLLTMATFLVCSQAAFAQSISLTKAENAEIKARLESFERGTVSLERLTDDRDNSLKLIAYYLSHTNDITPKRKLPIARSFFIWSKYAEAADLAKEYIAVNSNDWHAWRLLGSANMMTKSYVDALNAYTNAARLGDLKCFTSLGAAALQADRLDVFESVALPHLLAMMNDIRNVPETQRCEMRELSITYAINANKEDIFVRAIENVNAVGLLRHEDLKKLVAVGCGHFHSADTEKICQKLKIDTTPTP